MSPRGVAPSGAPDAGRALPRPPRLHGTIDGARLPGKAVASDEAGTSMESVMRNIFAFLRQSGDPLLEREFRELYQEPNVLYTRYGTLLAIVGFGGFYLMDAVAGRSPAIDWAGAARLAITLSSSPQRCGLLLLAVVRHTLLYARSQPLLPRGGRRRRAPANHGAWVPSLSELYWSLNASLVTAIIVIYGFAG